jgi:hypothetical protein
MLPENISVLRNNAIFAMIIQVISSVTGLLFFMIRRVTIFIFIISLEIGFIFNFWKNVDFCYILNQFLNFIVLSLPDNKHNLFGRNLRGHERCNLHEEIPHTFPRVIDNRGHRHFLRLFYTGSLFHSRRCITIFNWDYLIVRSQQNERKFNHYFTCNSLFH